jgi:small GTP-binding protein
MRQRDVKVVFLGSTSVGKTSIINRAVNKEFDHRCASTVGVAFASHVFHCASGSATLQIWDTAGQEQFRALAPLYYRGGDIAVLVFSVSDAASLRALPDWAAELRSQVSAPPALFVVGNKMDLVLQRTVTAPQGEAVAQGLGAHYCEVSAKAGTGIDTLFWSIAEEACGAPPAAAPPGAVAIAAPRKRKGGCC